MTIIFKKKKNINKEDSGQEMTFWDHMIELRKRLVRMVLAWIALSVVAFSYSRFIFDHILLAPKNSDFITYRWLCRLGELIHVKTLCLPPMNLQLISFNISGQFMTDMTVSMFSGLIMAAPIIIYQLWQFIMPALYDNERSIARKAVFIMTFLFLVGIAFSYFFMVPWTLNFLGSYQVSSMVANQISLSSYISTVTSTILSVGLVFELPVVVFVLSKIGIITPEFLKRNRKYSFVIILVLAAIITPPDVFSQIMVTAPLYGLYEISILVSKRVAPKPDPEDVDEEA